MKNAKIFLFLCGEGHTFQPNVKDSNYHPEIENLQVIGTGRGNTAAEALKNMLDENEYIKETSFDAISAIEIVNKDEEYFSIKEFLNQKL
jgi:hypothetical protein